MWFKLSVFCSESPKWKQKLFQPLWLKKHVLFGLLRSSLGLSLCWLKEGIRTRLLVYSFGKYVQFVFNKDDFKSRDSLHSRVTLSQPPRTFCSRGREYLNTNIIRDFWRLLVWVELFIRSAICRRKLMHYALRFVVPPWIHYHPSPGWARREECKHTVRWDLGSTSSFSWAVTPLPSNIWTESFSLIYCRCFWSKRWATASLPHVLAADRRLYWDYLRNGLGRL